LLCDPQGGYGSPTGRDEFVTALEDLRAVEEAETLVTHIVAAVPAYGHSSPDGWAVTACVGITICCQDIAEAEILLMQPTKRDLRSETRRRQSIHPIGTRTDRKMAVSSQNKFSPTEGGRQPPAKSKNAPAWVSSWPCSRKIISFDHEVGGRHLVCIELSFSPSQYARLKFVVHPSDEIISCEPRPAYQALRRTEDKSSSCVKQIWH
jgi:hypothetical protein